MDPRSTIAAHERERRLRLGWWIASIAVHAAAVLALAWWAGLRTWIFGDGSAPPPPQATRSGIAEAERVLRELYGRRLRQAGDDLAAIADEIAVFAAQRLDRLRQEDARLADAEPPALPAPAAAAGDAAITALYERACGNEHAAEAAYERLRAFDLAALQRLPVSRALTVSTMPRSARAETDRAVLAAAATSTAGLDRLKAELVAAHLEAQAAVASADRLRALARRVMGLETASDLVLADLMGAEAQAAHVAFQDDSEYIGALLFPTDKVVDGAVNVLDARPLLGTTIGDRHRAGDWLALDTWWIVGPFEHPGTARPDLLDRVYPPEARPGGDVDLDEVYAGKGGRVLRWLWHQSNTVRINPLEVRGMATSDKETYAIWYAWTEVWCDAPRTAWAAFGSDDYAAAWVNGELVYQSGRTPQAWYPFKPDSFRQIRLQAGLNRVLVKLENKGGLTAFSVCLNLDPEL